jgi:phospholipase/carboxylesterase
MGELSYAERPAKGEPDGLLILHHGRGGHETEMLEPADALDRLHRLHVFLPRAPFSFPRLDGYHWYAVRDIRYGDPETFREGYARLCEFHDHIWRSTGIPPERTVLGGFSMGCAMGYLTGLGTGRPQPAGILAFSGSIPTIDGWAPDFETRAGMPVLISHGRRDKAVKIKFARDARALLMNAGLDVTYHEGPGGHAIDERTIGLAIQWLAGVL